MSLTFADYRAFPEDGKRYEIVDGALYVNGSCSLRHQVVLGNVLAALWKYCRSHGGAVLPGRICVRLADDAVVEPDIVYVTDARRAILLDEFIDGAPDIVVEIVAAWTRELDKAAKFAIYERYGVREYWLVDPETETVAIYRRGAAGLEAIPSMDPITSPLLPGFRISFAEIFAE